ncbi:MAG: hypothetical protein ACERKV_02960 [Clostridiaceae bacterium]
MDNSLIIYIVIALFVLLLIVSLIKKAVKFILFIIGIILVLSLVNIFVYGVSPKAEINAYKTNIEYTKDIAGYTSKINSSVDKIKNVVESKNIDENSVATLNEENSNLHMYYEEVNGLDHTKKMDIFHDKYIGYLNTIVSTSDTSIKMANTAGSTIDGSEEMLNKLKDALNGLSIMK